MRLLSVGYLFLFARLLVGVVHSIPLVEESKTTPVIEKNNEVVAQKTNTNDQSSKGRKSAEAEEKLIDEKVKRLKARLIDPMPELPVSLDRMARFFFGNSDDGTENEVTTTSFLSNWMNNVGTPSLGVNKDFANLLNTNIDPEEVKRTLFDPNNIAVHVAENAFNFVTSSIGWAIAGALFNARNNNDNNYGTSYTKAVDQAPTSYLSPASTSNQYGYSQNSPFFRAFSSKKTDSNDNLYKLGKSGDLTATASTIKPKKSAIDPPKDEEIEELTVDQIKRLLDTEEKAQTGLFDTLSEKQKRIMYAKVREAAKKTMGISSQRREGNLKFDSPVIIPTSSSTMVVRRTGPADLEDKADLLQKLPRVTGESGRILVPKKKKKIMDGAVSLRRRRKIVKKPEE